MAKRYTVEVRQLMPSEEEGEGYWSRETLAGFLDDANDNNCAAALAAIGICVGVHDLAGWSLTLENPEGQRSRFELNAPAGD